MKKQIDRIYEYLDFKGIKPTLFAKKISISQGYLSTQFKRNADVGGAVLEKIIQYCEDVSPEWLLTGKGSMLRDAQPTTPSSLRDLPAISPCPELLAENTLLKATIADLKQDKAHLRDIIKHQQEQISFFLQHNKELEEVLSDYKEVIEDYQKKATQKG